MGSLCAASVAPHDQERVGAALRSMFAQQSKEEVLKQWDLVRAMIFAKFLE